MIRVAARSGLACLSWCWGPVSLQPGFFEPVFPSPVRYPVVLTTHSPSPSIIHLLFALLLCSIPLLLPPCPDPIASVSSLRISGHLATGVFLSTRDSF
ncbi:hypothetical protein F5X97DRAFT_212974 [Nemania serpens]|nr:hypothetical protein F5X97DRAFT_212974 [Nemania serpens]